MAAAKDWKIYVSPVRFRPQPDQSALAQNSVLTQNFVRFSGGIGVIPTGSANTTVRGVAAAGQIWVIRDLAADVKQDGGIRLDGRGLLLGSGNAVGSNANASVFATLSLRK
jgi:hypothetical protein